MNTGVVMHRNTRYAAEMNHNWLLKTSRMLKKKREQQNRNGHRIRDYGCKIVYFQVELHEPTEQPTVGHREFVAPQSALFSAPILIDRPPIK